MAHDVRVVGNRFVYLCRENDYRLTGIGLQKFIFLAHGWHMGLYGIENRMLDDRAEVWRRGPVVETGHRAFQGLGHLKRKYAPIPEEAHSELNDCEIETCDFVMERYGHLSPFELTSSANARRVHDIRVVGNRFVHLCRENYYPLTSVGLQKFNDDAPGGCALVQDPPRQANRDSPRGNPFILSQDGSQPGHNRRAGGARATRSRSA
jgi:uncharacterized phage-associated protein